MHSRCLAAALLAYSIDGRRRVPIVADAGADEIVFVPTGRRLHCHTFDWHRISDDMELYLAMAQR